MSFAGKHHSPETRALIGASAKGRRHTEEAKRKIGAWERTEEYRNKVSESHKGIYPSAETRLKLIEIAKRRKFSDETRERMSKSHKGKGMGENNPMFGKHSISGEKHYNWKGGLTPTVERIRKSIEYRQWRISVFKRDNHTCQSCGTRGGYLEAHHTPRTFMDILSEHNIKTVEDAISCMDLMDINNGITLCKKCHDLTKCKILVVT